MNTGERTMLLIIETIATVLGVATLGLLAYGAPLIIWIVTAFLAAVLVFRMIVFWAVELAERGERG